MQVWTLFSQVLQDGTFARKKVRIDILLYYIRNILTTNFLIIIILCP